MLRSPIIVALAGRTARRQLRRLGGTETLAWAVRVPLVTLVVAAALAPLLAGRRGGRSPR